MSILRVIFCIRDENEMLVVTLDMWKFSNDLDPPLADIVFFELFLSGFPSRL